MNFQRGDDGDVVRSINQQGMAVAGGRRRSGRRARTLERQNLSRRALWTFPYFTSRRPATRAQITQGCRCCCHPAPRASHAPVYFGVEDHAQQGRSLNVEQDSDSESVRSGTAQAQRVTQRQLPASLGGRSSF
jgi:hypothetical protein